MVTEKQVDMKNGNLAISNKLKASLEELSTVFLNSDFLGGLIDVSREAIELLTEVIDKLGLIPSLLTAIGTGFGAFKALQGEGRVKCCPLFKYAFGEFSGDVYELCY